MKKYFITVSVRRDDFIFHVNLTSDKEYRDDDVINALLSKKALKPTDDVLRITFSSYLNDLDFIMENYYESLSKINL